MGYFAQLDETDTVQQVIRIENDVLGEDMLSFPDTEPVGRAFIANTLGLPGEWRQTSFNGNFRKCYAGAGYYFDRERDEFVPPGFELVNSEWVAPQPYPSWGVVNGEWLPPVPMPDDGERYEWNEDAQEWQAVETE